MEQSKEKEIKNQSMDVGLCHYQIAAFALLKHLFLPKYKEHTGKKYILLFFSAHIGDAVMFLDTLQRYQAYYSEENGYHLVFACRKEVWSFLTSLGCTGDMEFIEVNRDEILRSFSKFKKAVKAASKYQYDVFISPRTVSIIEYVFEYCLCAKDRYVVRIKDDNSKSSKKERIFRDGQKNEVIEVERTMMLLRRFGLLADKLTGVHVPVRISRLPIPETDLETPKKYFVFAPSTAETPSKCWSRENYARLIDELIEKEDVDICFSGGKNDRVICDMVKDLVVHKERIHDYVGTTNFKEWISLIAGADLAVCNDSSPMHIAASVGTKCVCIGGQWEGSCYYPYDVDEVRENDCIPEVVLGEKLPCYYCTTTLMGRKGNSECKEAIDKAEPYPCIKNVMYESVREKVL